MFATSAELLMARSLCMMGDKGVRYGNDFPPVSMSLSELFPDVPEG